MITPVFEYLESIDSTNDEIRRRMQNGSCPDGLVIAAAEQTKGKGRRGHVWQSPPGTSLATSMGLYPTIDLAHIPRITILAALGVADAVEKLSGLRTEIKWPNDVLIRDRKICGILTEMDAEDGHVKDVIVGIGVNVHTREFPPDIARIATSVDIELARAGSEQHVARRALNEELWRDFLGYYEKFQANLDLAPVLPAYNARLVNKDRRVRVLDPLGEYDGTARGIDSTGALLVETAAGTRRVDSGEVSVRGIYGYV